MDLTYRLVRYAPDSARGEERNIGVVAGSYAAGWAARLLSAHDLRRVNAGAHAVLPWLRDFERLLPHPGALFGTDEDAASRHTTVADHDTWLALVAARSNNSLRLTDPLPVLARTPQDGADFLFDELVALVPRKPRMPNVQRVVEALEARYGDLTMRHPGLRMLDRPTTRVGLQEVKFSVGLADQERPVQLVKVWSLQATDLSPVESQMAGWTLGVRRLRDGIPMLIGDARGRENQRGYTVPADVDVVATLVLPELRRRSQKTKNTVEAARDFFRSAGVNTIEATAVKQLEVPALARG